MRIRSIALVANDASIHVIVAGVVFDGRSRPKTMRDARRRFPNARTSSA